MRKELQPVTYILAFLSVLVFAAFSVLLAAEHPGSAVEHPGSAVQP